MGTTYNIKIVTDKNFNTKEIKTSIDSILVVLISKCQLGTPKVKFQHLTDGTH